MVDITNIQQSRPEQPKDVLQEILREGARRMLQEAIHQEVTEYLEHYQTLKDENDHSLAVRNG